MSEQKLHIRSAAIFDAEGKTVWEVDRPARHHDVIRAICEETGREFVPHHWEQGFVASNGQFYGRIASKQIARDAGQLLPRACNLPQLFSEDVW